MAKEGKAVHAPGPAGRQQGKVDIKKVMKDPGGTIKRLLSFMTGKYRMMFFGVMLLIVVSALVGVIGSLFLQTLIDDYIAPLRGMDTPDFAPLLKALVTLSCIYLAGILSNLIYHRMMATVAHGVLKKIRDEMFDHMQDLPIRYFDSHTHGDIMSHYTNDTDTLRQMIAISLPQTVNAVVQVVAVFFSMIYLSWQLTLLVLFGVFLMMRLTAFISGKSGAYFVAGQKSLGKLNGYIEEMIHGQKVVKVFCHEEAAKEGFDALNEDLCEQATKANTLAQIMMPLTGNFGNFIYVVVAIVGGALAIFGGTITVGSIAAFLQLTKSFVMPISQVSMQASSIIMALAGAERIFELMDEPVEEDHGFIGLVPTVEENGVIRPRTDGKHTTTWAWKCPQTPDAILKKNDAGEWYWQRKIDGRELDMPVRGIIVEDDGPEPYGLIPLEGHVELVDVNFGYVPEKIVLKDVSLVAMPGQKVAFVGATGAGKTTITNLINRFYDIQEGIIAYDGIPITDIRKKELRRSLGMVLQDVNLFTGTVRENIRYGRLDATDEEVEAAAKLANAHEFIIRLPQGYDTMLDGDGGSLSQGQRQLLSIARAAVADPPAMIMDEATSSIDTRTEAIVQKGTDSLMKGRTVFVIAHRLSTVQNSDAIMVLEQGRIIERGNHEELIAQKGKYYQLYTGAFELE